MYQLFKQINNPVKLILYVSSLIMFYIKGEAKFFLILFQVSCRWLGSWSVATEFRYVATVSDRK